MGKGNGFKRQGCLTAKVLFKGPQHTIMPCAAEMEMGKGI